MLFLRADPGVDRPGVARLAPYIQCRHGWKAAANLFGPVRVIPLPRCTSPRPVTRAVPPAAGGRPASNTCPWISLVKPLELRAARCGRVLLTGGEPLLHPRWLEIADQFDAFVATLRPMDCWSVATSTRSRVAFTPSTSRSTARAQRPTAPSGVSMPSRSSSTLPTHFGAPAWRSRSAPPFSAPTSTRSRVWWTAPQPSACRSRFCPSMSPVMPLVAPWPEYTCPMSPPSVGHGPGRGPRVDTCSMPSSAVEPHSSASWPTFSPWRRVALHMSRAAMRRGTTP